MNWKGGLRGWEFVLTFATGVPENSRSENVIGALGGREQCGSPALIAGEGAGEIKGRYSRSDGGDLMQHVPDAQGEAARAARLDLPEKAQPKRLSR